jgi:fatty-acyl-CoA synthase
MDGQMMDFQLTLPHILKRAETYFGRGEIVTRLPDKSFHRTTYAETLRRSRQLAVALAQLGLERGDRVATLCWNHYQHHEAYFGIPCGGFVLHTLNLRLHPNDLAYIANHAGDKVVIVDRSLLPLLEQFRDRTQIEHVFVVEDSYEDLLAGASADDWVEPDLDENEAAAMCYTSGTTGLPKGVVYSHRSSVLHALGVAANNPLGLNTSVHDTILPVVPMFHANAWGYPYVATMLGAKLVYPGPHLDAQSLLEDFVQEKVTWSAGVPTIWLSMLQALEASPGAWDLSHMKGMFVGGSAVPRALIAAFQRHGLTIVQGWGMTETSPVASTSDLPHDLASLDEESQLDLRATAGLPLALVELRARVGDEEIPWDGEAMGELEVRGPWVASSYYDIEAGSGGGGGGANRPPSPSHPPPPPPPPPPAGKSGGGSMDR